MFIFSEPQLSIAGKKLEPAQSAKNANDGAKKFSFVAEQSGEEPENHFPSFRKSSPPKAIQMAKLHKQPKSAKTKLSTSQSEAQNKEVLSKNEILARMGITNPESENVFGGELSKSSNNLGQVGGGTFVTDKKEIQSTIISNLDKEVQRLRMKIESIDEEKMQAEREELDR